MVSYFSIFSEDLLKRQTDCLVSGGFRELGYEYVTIDDCWLEKERDASGKLQPDHTRFPSGMKDLAKYVSINLSCYNSLSNIFSSRFLLWTSVYNLKSCRRKPVYINVYFTRYIFVLIKDTDCSVFFHTLPVSMPI